MITKTRIRALIAGLLFQAGTSVAEGPVDTVRVGVDYATPLSQLIAAGRYNTVDDRVLEDNFPVRLPVPMSREIEIVIFRLNRWRMTDSVLFDLDRFHLRPATLRELLAFGAAHDDTTEGWDDFVALGSIVNYPPGCYEASMIFVGPSGRSLRLDRFDTYNCPGQEGQYQLQIDHGWYEDDGILAVSKSQPAAEDSGSCVLQTSPLLHFEVDDSLPLERAIESGQYTNVDRRITAENFPERSSGVRHVEAMLIRLDRPATADEILEEIGRQGLRSATLRELLAFSASSPTMDFGYGIIALNAVTRSRGGERWVAMLSGDREQHRLWLIPYNEVGWWRGWSDYRYKFLTIRKEL